MRFINFYLIVLLLGCNGSKPDQGETVISFTFIPYYTGTIYLEKLSFSGEKNQVLDSAELDLQTDRVEFTIPPMEESVFQLRIRNVPNRIYFVNEGNHVDIKAGYPDLRAYDFTNAPSNASLRKFLDEQRMLVARSTQVAGQKDTGSHFSNPFPLDPFRKSEQLLRNREIGYADTTKSPGAFLFLYNRIDFGRDYQGLKQFVNKAAKRFPEHTGIRKLNEATNRLVRIFEEEYQVGDRLPDVQLNDPKDQPFSLSNTRGKLVFLDFWSTWCPQCMVFLEVKDRIKTTYGDRVEVVSIALDAKKENWKKMVASLRNPGIQLIDEKMWQGKAAETFKIDSIPFNFLVSPEGTILAKAIKKDSVLPLISRLIK